MVSLGVATMCVTLGVTKIYFTLEGDVGDASIGDMVHIGSISYLGVI